MAFERKETTTEDVNLIYWNLLKWFWIIIPTFYFTFVVPRMPEIAGAGTLQPNVMYTMIFHMLNLAFAGILTQTHVLEQSKSGAGDKILKAAIIHQFIIQNYIGIALTIFVWYKLPYKVKPEMVPTEELEKSHFQPKTLYILTGVVLLLTILAIISQMT